MNKNISLVLIVLSLIVGIGVGYISKDSISLGAANITHFKDIIDSTRGFSINGTTFIDSSRNLTISGTSTISNLVVGNTKVVFASSTATAISAAQLCSGTTYYEWLPNGGSAGALIFPSSTQALSACMASNGNYKEFFYKNLASAAASTTLVQAGASSTLVVINATSTDGTGTSSIRGGGLARFTILVTSSTDNTNGLTILMQKY